MNVDAAVWVALIVATLSSTVGPVLVTRAAGRQARKTKEQDWERQDQVAAQAREAAELLLAANERVAAQSAEESRVINGKIDVVHTLVNSQLTSALDDALDANVALLTLMKEAIALRTANGTPPSDETMAAVHALESKIQARRNALHDRTQQNDAAQEQMRRNPTDAVGG